MSAKTGAAILKALGLEPNVLSLTITIGPAGSIPTMTIVRPIQVAAGDAFAEVMEEYFLAEKATAPKE
jgi:hypothetical protein